MLLLLSLKRGVQRRKEANLNKMPFNTFLFINVQVHSTSFRVLWHIQTQCAHVQFRIRNSSTVVFVVIWYMAGFSLACPHSAELYLKLLLLRFSLLELKFCSQLLYSVRIMNGSTHVFQVFWFNWSWLQWRGH